MRVAAIQSGLPFDTAFAAPDDFVLAWIVANGENKGGQFFDWDAMKWVAQK